MTFGKVIAVAITGGLLALASMAAVHAADKKKPAAASEGGPSRQETIEFIPRRGSEFGSFSETYTPTSGDRRLRFPTNAIYKTSFAVSGGNLTIDATDFYIVDRNGTDYDIKIMKTKRDLIAQMALNSLSTKVGFVPLPDGRASCVIKLECAGGAKCIDIKTTWTIGKDSFANIPSDDVAQNLYFSNHDQCKRMAKALSHLIELSGGKKEKDAF